jgi:hypothetical protein
MSEQRQRTACLLPSYQLARAGGGDEDKGRGLAGMVWFGLASSGPA